MKRIIFFLTFLLPFGLIFAQTLDSIIKTDGSVIQGKVLSVNSTQIEFDPTGTIPFIVIPRKEVESILYADGTLVKLGNERIVSTVPTSLNFIDSSNYPLRELLILDQVFATTTYAAAGMEGTVESDEFYSDVNKNDVYKISIRTSWNAQGSAGKFFSKDGATIYCQSLTYSVTLSRNGESVFSRSFAEQNFNFKIIRALIQGREQTVEGSRVIPEFTSNQNTFSYGGVNFTVNVRFWNGTYIWEPNTRIGDAYLTYRASFKILVSQ